MNSIHTNFTFPFAAFTLRRSSNSYQPTRTIEKILSLTFRLLLEQPGLMV